MVIASRAMDQSCLSPFGLPSSNSSSFFSDEIRIPERQVVGFWKPESVVDQTGSKLVFSSSLEKLRPVGANPAGCVGNPGPHTFNSQKGMFSLDNNLVGQEKASSLPSTSWGDARTSYGSRHGFSTKESTFVEPSVDRHLSDYENGGFSSSFSEMFSSKLRLTSNSALGQSNSALGQSVDTNNSSCEEGEPLGSMEEIEAQTIGDLLPDDDDLISGIIDDFEYTGLSTIRDDVDEDIFFTSGGMELENDDALKSLRIPDGFLKGQLFGEHVSGERSSRTLFVRNIDTNIDDSELRVLFQQYGDIDMMYTSCKHRGFVIISYYDIRAAQNAIRALHYKPLGLRNLDIGFSIPKDHLSDKDIGQDIGQGTLVISNLDSSVSKDDLCQILSVYGDIKEIHKASAKCTHNFIEFYDVRAAESARRGLSKNCISGQKIKLEPSHPGVAAYCLTQQCSIELKQEEHGTFLQRPNNSLPGCLGKVVPKSQEIGSFHGLFSSVSPLMDKSLHGINSSVPPKLSSPIKIESIQQHNNKPALGELNESHSRRGIEVFHPRSLPEYQDSMSNNPKSITPSGMNVNSRLAEGVDYSYLHKAGMSRLHGHSFDKNEAFGVSGIGSCPLHGYHYVWNSTNAFPQSPSAPMLWSNLQHPMHVHGFPGPPPQMLNTGALPVDQLRLGSAPAYGGSFTDINSFNPGSLGNVGFHGSPQWYPSEFAVFPPAGGNYREPLFSPVSVGFPSPQQRCHVINGRNHMFNISTSYDAPNDRMRSRRNDVNADQPDNKKQFELDIDHIANGEDSRTTLMIKNIPNKYTCKMLLAVIDENHRGTYDFIYLPIDFKNKCNVGYAFVNMTEPKHIVSFFKTFNGKKWEKFNSEKVASLAYARIQGRGALIAHFQNSSLMNEDKRCRPMLFHKDGPNAGDQEPFPIGNNVRSRPGRNRTFTNLDTQQGSPSSSPNQETSTSGADLPLGSTEDPLE